MLLANAPFARLNVMGPSMANAPGNCIIKTALPLPCASKVKVMAAVDVVVGMFGNAYTPPPRKTSLVARPAGVWVDPSPAAVVNAVSKSVYAIPTVVAGLFGDV